MRHEHRLLEFRDSYERPCRIYAERLIPQGKRLCGILHCVGGGQRVSRADLEFWARQGYACASFDWQIGDLAGRSSQKQSVWPNGVRAQHAPIQQLDEAILPLAALAGRRVLDWLGEDPSVESDAFGISGISWGGYLAWLIAALDQRIVANVSVYGCGLFHEPLPYGISPAVADHWKKHWDPHALAHKQRAPACYLSATNDFFGRMHHAWELLDRLKQPFRTSFLPNADHAISQTERALASAWMDHYLRSGEDPPEMPRLTPGLAVHADERHPIERIELWWTARPKPSRFACWHPGSPPKNQAFKAAFARVIYRSGISLCSPTISPTDETTATLAASSPKRPDGRAPGSHWLDLRAGTGWRWELGGVGLAGADPVLEPVNEGTDQLRILPAPGNSDAPVALLLHQFSDSAWNLPSAATVAFDFQPDNGQPTAISAIGLAEVAGTTKEFPISCSGDTGHYELHFATSEPTPQSIRLEFKMRRQPFTLGSFRTLDPHEQPIQGSKCS